MQPNRITRPEARVLAEEEFIRFADLVASLTPEEWATPTDCTGWDVRKMVLHVLGSAEAQASVREFVHQLRHGMPLNKEIDSHHWVDGMNELQIRERNQLSNDELVVGELVALANLQLVHAVDPVVRIDLLVERHAVPQLVDELSDRRLGFGRAEDVQHHLTDVPTGAIGGRRPLLRRERRDQVREAYELLLGQHPGLGTCDSVGLHQCLLLLSTSSTYRSTRRLR